MASLDRIGFLIRRMEESEASLAAFSRRGVEVTSHFLDEPCHRGKEHPGYCVKDWNYMASHAFKSEDGEVIERSYSVHEDIIPTEITEDGKTYKRVWSFRGFTIK